MKSLILTGASGFVGGTFLREYASTYQIKTVDLRTTPTEQISFQKIDCVVHCAALVHQMKGAPEEKFFEVNFELTRQLALRAKEAGVGHFVFLSTVAVYGSENEADSMQKLSEKSPCRPSTAYGKSKLAAENYLLCLADPNFKVAIIRPPMVYGEGAKGNLPMLVKLIRWFPLLPFRHDSNRRSFVYVRNLTHFMMLTINQRAQGVFIAQDASPISLQFLVEEIAKALDKRIYLVPASSLLLNALSALRPETVAKLYGSFILDSTASNEVLGFQPPFSTEQGLQNMFRK